MIKMEIEKLEARAEEASKLLDAMSNPKRLLIMCNLVEGELNVTDLAKRVGLGQSALSQHLSKLRALGFVSARRDGQQIYYSVASPAVEKVLATLYDVYCAD